MKKDIKREIVQIGDQVIEEVVIVIVNVREAEEDIEIDLNQGVLEVQGGQDPEADLPQGEVEKTGMIPGHQKERDLTQIAVNLPSNQRNIDPKVEMIVQFLQSEVSALNQDSHTPLEADVTLVMVLETDLVLQEVDVILGKSPGADLALQQAVVILMMSQETFLALHAKDQVLVSQNRNSQNLVIRKFLQINCMVIFHKTKLPVRKQMLQQ